MSRFDEKFLLREINKKVAEAERRAFLSEALRGQKRPAYFRQRSAQALIRIATWLAPDAATDMPHKKSC